MTPKYGTYDMTDGVLGRISVSTEVEIVENDARQVVSRIERRIIEGHLGGTTTNAQMDDKVRRLRNAFAVNGRNFSVYLPGGNTLSQLSLLNTGSLAGVRVKNGPNLQAAGASYVTWQPYTVTLEAEYPAAGSSLLYREFEETIEVEGGGRVDGWLKPLNTGPIRQTLMQQDTYRARQSGMAVGLYARPSPPAPIWPAFLIRAGRFSKRSPKPRGAFSQDFAISWSYEFESNVPLTGEPNQWPSV
jgi:hypothetical protein